MAQLAEDPWLSEQFGHPVFTVTEPGGEDLADESLAESLRRHAGGFGAVSYQAKLPADEVAAAAALTAAGFSVVNVGITLERDLDEVSEAEGEVEIRPGTGDDDEVLGIAERSFTRTRFHLDPRIPQEVADRLKREWIANCLRGERGTGVLVALREGRPAGFLAVVPTRDEGGAIAVIDLIAVDPSSRGAGVGAALVRRFLTESRRSSDRARVSTQAANPAAIRFYERLGFETAYAGLDLHLHLGSAWDRG